MNLKHLTDKILLEDAKKLASAEREITVKVLHHLKEIERRKLFSDLGFSSLFDYCVRELKYTEAAAQRRIVAARLLQEIPAIESKIESGSLNLSNVASLVQFFREENIIDPQKKSDFITKVEGLSTRECELKLMQLGDKQPIRKEAIWVTEDVVAKLKEYRDLKGTNESWAEIVSEVLDIAIAEIQRSRFKLVKNPGKPSDNASRVPSASVKREVYLRDQKCTKCGSKRSLQYDHKQPYSLGGKSTSENIRLLCFNCNQRERIRQRL